MRVVVVGVLVVGTSFEHGVADEVEAPPPSASAWTRTSRERDPGPFGDAGGVVVLDLDPTGADLHPHRDPVDLAPVVLGGRRPPLERGAARPATRSRWSSTPASWVREGDVGERRHRVGAGRPFFITMGVTQASWAPAASTEAMAWARVSPVASSTFASSSTTGWPALAARPSRR